jgi:hypothetical protein
MTVRAIFPAFLAPRRPRDARIFRPAPAAGFRQCRHCGGGPDRAQCGMARHRIGIVGPAGLAGKARGPDPVMNEPVVNEPVTDYPLTSTVE